MDTYILLQQYWWFIISLLGGILAFLLFVQGTNSMLFSIGRTETERGLIIASTGRKWEFTFTTLVLFGGAFFASFPLFYSTSFGGAYWLWMIILFSFVLQAVSYEFQHNEGNLLGKSVYRSFLVANGIIAPFLLGVAIATFFTGADFIIDKSSLQDSSMPVISRWTSAWNGLEALLVPWNLIMGFAVLFLSRCLGNLYIINSIADENLACRSSVRLVGNAVVFLLFFVTFVIHVLLSPGCEVGQTGEITIVPYKYWNNFITLWPVLLTFLVGVLLVLYGIVRTVLSSSWCKGIWPTGVGTIITVTSLLLCAGWNHTCYYPSVSDVQSSLHLSNSCSSLFTLQTMTWVSILIPFVLIYIWYAWRSISKKKITPDELEEY
ncbi:MAG: cytochrome d ubiquinol oxidase subunit II [Bacteroidaceae bacterium]|nr:cytochrome d ubiquinol oxidase subunit II [Bacteroidaceae bacterium]